MMHYSVSTNSATAAYYCRRITQISPDFSIEKSRFVTTQHSLWDVQSVPEIKCLRILPHLNVCNKPVDVLNYKMWG